MPFRRVVLLLAVTVPVFAVTGCSSDSTPTIKVVATDTACTPTPAEARAGKMTFEVDNQGSVITELYLYAIGDRPVGEVENIDPGTKGRFTVEVGGGSYQVACKPNQIGDGIRSAFTVSGPSATDLGVSEAPTARGGTTFTQSVVIDDRGFVGLEDFVVQKGQTVTFLIENRSSATHALAVLGPDGSTVGGTGPIDPGKPGDFKAQFTVPGTYTAVDPTGDNRQHGYEVSFTVNE